MEYFSSTKAKLCTTIVRSLDQRTCELPSTNEKQLEEQERERLELEALEVELKEFQFDWKEEIAWGGKLPLRKRRKIECLDLSHPTRNNKETAEGEMANNGVKRGICRRRG